MKSLKFAPSLLLSLVLAFLLSAPALAVEGELPERPEPVPAVVCTLDELLTAIESAESGDTIALQGQIVITENCIIGQEEKRITIIPVDDFNGNTMFQIWPFEGQNIVLQNIVLDGQNKSDLSALEVNFYGAPNSIGTISLTGIEVKNFSSTHSNVYINNISAVVYDCQFRDNTAQRTAGIEIAPNATINVADCVFSDNSSLGNGGALLCEGQARIDDTLITQNQAVSPDSARMGGGIYIGQQGYCEIVDCQISDNTAHLGGGIANWGHASIMDIVLCENQGLNGASDIMTFSSEHFTVSYSTEIGEIYSESNPIGFYLDDMDNRFSPDSNTVFLGESLTGDIPMNQYGAKFIFASDLPQVPPEESENPGEQIPPTEPPTTPQEPNTPDTSEPPVIPVIPEQPVIPAIPNEPGEDVMIPSTPVKPTRPTIEKPPVIQQEEPSAKEKVPKLKLSRGGATLDTAIPLVLLGYGDGQLHENDPVTRAQIVVLLYRSLTSDSKSAISDRSPFADIANGTWYYDAVTVLSSAGIINGCDGLFRPNDTLTYGQLIAILTRFVEPKEAPVPDGLPYTGHWAYSNIVTAVAYGWIDNAEEIEPDRPITRGEAVKFVNLIFEKCR